MAAGEVQLRVEGVAKQFGGVTAVDEVSLEVREGEILSVIGPNGAGKTSLLNMVSGFYRPDRGRISFEGAEITSLPPSRIAELGIARTFQNIALFKGMTVLDNLMLGRHVRMKAGVLASFVYWGFAQKEEIAAVITHKDDPKEKQWFRSLGETAKSRGVKVLYSEDLNAAALESTVKNLKPTHILSFYYRHMIPMSVLNAAPMALNAVRALATTWSICASRSP